MNFQPTPAAIDLTADPAIVTLGSPVTFSVTASDFACSMYIPSPLSDTDALLNFASRSEGPPRDGWRGSAVLALLLLPIPLISLRQRRGWSLPAVLMVLAVSSAIVGCNGMQPNHTGPGTYSLTLTGKAAGTGQSHSVNFSLIVTG